MTKRILKDEVSVPMAVDRLIQALKADEGYFMSWQANIAVQFQDEFTRVLPDKPISFDVIHEISNIAAKNFLNMLIITGEPEPDESHFEKSDDLWVTAGENPVNTELSDRIDPPEDVILADNGGSMDDIIGKSAEEVFPEVIKGVKGTVEAFPEIDEDNEDHDLSELVKERQDQDEIKVDPKDL